MKTRFLIAASLAAAFISLDASAQLDERKPGLYAVIDSVSTPLAFVCGTSLGGGVGIGPVAIGSSTYAYKGVTSGVKADGTFVLVVDPDKKVGIITPKKFNNFVSKLTPNELLVLPLVTNHKKNRREYNTGTTVGVGIGPVGMNIKTDSRERPGFEWERISDNSFQIKLTGLAAGEYGIITRVTKASEYLYAYLFGFTIE